MRILGLDLIRFLAIFLVLGRHLHLPSNPHILLQLWQTGGWVGVDLFFVLSGFLVSGLIFKEFQRDHRIDVKRFLIRRGLKIYPAFYVLIVFTILVRDYLDVPIPVQPLLGEIFFLQNYLGGLWNHTWSLAIEEHFYFGFALLCFILLRKFNVSNGLSDPFRYIPIIFISVAVLCLLMRISNYYMFESYSHQWFLFRTHIRIDSLLFGVYLSYLWHFKALEKRIEHIHSTLLFAIGLILLLPAFIFPLEKYMAVSIFLVIIFYIGSGAIILSMIRMRESQHTILTIGGTLGAASYSIYLWHIPIGIWGWPLIKKVSNFDGYFLYFLFYILGSLLFGYIMNKVLERPVLIIRDRYFPKT